jgi:hypothetical protein
VDVQAYHQSVVTYLTAQGYCAKDDGDEIALKNSNDFSEQYQIDLSSHQIRNNEGAYRASCYPAAF